MRLRELLTRWSKQERHRRKAERDRRRGRHERLGKRDAREVFEMGQLVHQIKTGEFPIVERAFDDPPVRPLPEPMRSEFAMAVFQDDPLGSAILPKDLDDAPEFLDAVCATTRAGVLTEAGASDLERTGAWYAWEIRQLVKRGAPK